MVAFPKELLHTDLKLILKALWWGTEAKLQSMFVFQQIMALIVHVELIYFCYNAIIFICDFPMHY